MREINHVDTKTVGFCRLSEYLYRTVPCAPTGTLKAQYEYKSSSTAMGSVLYSTEHKVQRTKYDDLGIYRDLQGRLTNGTVQEYRKFDSYFQTQSHWYQVQY